MDDKTLRLKSRIDLIAKEFKNHQHCYLEFTRPKCVAALSSYINGSST